MGLLGAAIFIGLGIFGGETEKSFERRAAWDIAGRLEGESKQVSVNVTPNGLGAAWGDLKSAEIRASDFAIDGLPLFTEPDRSQAGKVGTLKLSLREFSLKKLKVESLEAIIPGCRYDYGLAQRRGQIRLSRSGIGTGEVTIRQSDLADYVVKKFSEIKRCTIEIKHGLVWIRGYGEFLIVNSEFKVIARIGVEDGSKLVLTDVDVFFGDRLADEMTAKALLQTLNPVVDMRKDLGLYDAVTVEGVKLADGKLRAWGKTKIPIKPTDNKQ